MARDSRRGRWAGGREALLGSAGGLVGAGHARRGPAEVGWLRWRLFGRGRADCASPRAERASEQARERVKGKEGRREGSGGDPGAAGARVSAERPWRNPTPGWRLGGRQHADGGAPGACGEWLVGAGGLAGCPRRLLSGAGGEESGEVPLPTRRGRKAPQVLPRSPGCLRGEGRFPRHQPASVSRARSAASPPRSPGSLSLLQQRELVLLREGTARVSAELCTEVGGAASYLRLQPPSILARSLPSHSGFQTRVSPPLASPPAPPPPPAPGMSTGGLGMALRRTVAPQGRALSRSPAPRPIGTGVSGTTEPNLEF